MAVIEIDPYIVGLAPEAGHETTTAHVPTATK